LTGRQNAWHAASILGHGAADIYAAMPEIEKFAEIGHYFDQPVRVYSSGMQLRLAFSVVTAFRPELLIIDEALSVGDAYFQHKCFDRIKDYKKQGTSLLFVSHDAAAVLNLCDRAILLEYGKLIKDDNPGVVLDFYNATLAEKEKGSIETTNNEEGEVQTVSGSRLARVETIQILDMSGNSLETVKAGDEIRLQAKVVIEDSLPELVFGYKIKDRLGQVMYGTNTFHLDGVLNDLRKGERIVYSFDFPVNLGPGSYSVSTALHSRDTHIADNYEWRELALMFHVINTTSVYSVGSSWMPPAWEVERG
jgi:lipopolysaccharide transport system ATP-binding protein